jgi:hypothetical protein
MRAKIVCALGAVLYLFADIAWGQQPAPAPAPRGELDVTMQIIVDPDAKLPDEVVRKIPLPAPRAGQPTRDASKNPSAEDPASKGQERAREARELGREISEQAKQKGQEAAEQREQARRSAAENERRRNPGPPGNPPGRPPAPPGRP